MWTVTISDWKFGVLKLYPLDEPDPKELEKSVERTEMVSRGSYIIREAGAIGDGAQRQ